MLYVRLIPRNGRQDPPNPDARKSTDHQSEQRLYRETCRSPLEDLDLDGNFTLQPDQQLRLRQRTGSSTTIKVGILGPKVDKHRKGTGMEAGTKVDFAKEMEEEARVAKATEFRFCRCTTLMAT